MTRFEAIEAARLARGQRDTTAPVADETKRYGGRVREVEPNGLRFRFQFPGANRPQRKGGKGGKGGFQNMTPERRAEVSRKAIAARASKVTAERRSEIARMGGVARVNKLGPERVRELCTKAIKARWANHG